jgi:hypothetical protein
MKGLWQRWVVANALGEMVGLGLTFGVGALYFTQFGDPRGLVFVLASFAVAVASGAIEASVVGLAQWWAMHPWFPRVTQRAWWLATLFGALAAYVFGYLPSTIINLSEQSAAGAQAAPMVEPPQWVVLLLAAGMGAAAGVFLSFTQWLVLRKQVGRASIWIPANMLAWAAGMPAIFWSVDMAQRGQPLWQAILIMAAALLVAGGVVGAIHGAFLVWMAKPTVKPG